MVVVYLLYLFFHETYPNLLSHETRFGLSKARVISHCLGQCLPTSSILFLARTRSCSSIAEKNKCTRVIRYCIGLVQFVVSNNYKNTWLVLRKIPKGQYGRELEKSLCCRVWYWHTVSKLIYFDITGQHCANEFILLNRMLILKYLIKFATPC